MKYILMLLVFTSCSTLPEYCTPHSAVFIDRKCELGKKKK